MRIRPLKSKQGESPEELRCLLGLMVLRGLEKLLLCSPTCSHLTKG